MGKTKKAPDKNTPGLHNTKSHTGKVNLLIAMRYRECMVYVRQVEECFFMWDAIFEGQLYSHYVYVPLEGRKKLPAEIVKQMTEMCYAGATTTIDVKKGIELSEKDKKMVAEFEKLQGSKLSV